MERLEGTTLGRYRVDRLIGSGGMGAVWAGVQQPLGRPVAIKVLRPELSADAEVVARFKREAELAASLSHPNIAQVTDFGVESGRAFLVMDLLEGESLADLIRRERRLPPARVQRIGLQVLTALGMAHERGIVHRDLKPENVFVQHVSGMDLVKLLDFGIARMIAAEGSSSGPALTTTGAVLGTPAYMSPEQARGKKVDARSDLFSLAALLYEALTGDRPFVGENYHELMFAVVESTPPPIASLVPDCPPALASAIERAMQKAPDARFASAREMRDAIEGSSAPAREPTPNRSENAFAATMASEPRAPAPARTSAARWWIAGAIAAIAAGALALPRLLATDEPIAIAPPVAPPADDPPASAEPIAAPASPPPSEPAAPEPAAPVPPPEPIAPPEHHPARPRTYIERCGEQHDDPREFRVVGARDRLYFGSLNAHDVRFRSSEAMHEQLDPHIAEITACFRGHGIPGGQDFRVFVDGTGRVERVEAHRYCPIDASVASCVARILAPLQLPLRTDTPGWVDVGVSLAGM